MKKILVSTALLIAGIASSTVALADRDVISIVGSSTVYPFATSVAEHFGHATNFKTPKIESTGSGGGMKLFCQGVGVNHPDITNSSRRIKPSEVELCAKNGVEEIIEVKIGFDGIVLGNVNTASQLKLTTRDIFLALAKDIPNPDGSQTLIPNPYLTWKDVNPTLPATKIEVLGPPPTSGTRDAFAELALEGGCSSYDWIKKIKDQDENRFKAICQAIREDGHYIEAGENDNLIVQKLKTNPAALGVFGFSFLDQNTDTIQGALVNDVEPTFEAIADGSYPVSRSLYFYVKKAHIGLVDGLQEYVAEFSSEKAWGDDGYLADKGMIPLPKAMRDQVAADVKALKLLSL